MSDPTVTVNGTPRTISGVPAHTTVLDWLRQNRLTGCKEGCAEGECGACAILVATVGENGGTEWTSVNACLVPVYAMDGQELVTAEGLGSPEHPHPVQANLAAAGGSQCGYCTPGFACSMAAEFYRADRVPADPAAQEVHADPEHGPNGFDLHALSGNLCRCTGYRPIRDAAYALGAPRSDDPLQQRLSRSSPGPTATDVVVDGARFVRPESLEETLRLLHEEEDAMLVAGCTDWGVEVNLRGRRAPLVIAIDSIEPLRTLTIGTDIVEIGAALSLSELERHLDGRIPLLSQLFPQFASPLIRNRATLGGNLGTGSPIGDAPPALLALGARIVLAAHDPQGGSGRAEREVDLADYFTGYRKSVKRPDELIRAIRIPLPLATTTAFHKITKRRFDDISSVAVAFALDIHDGVVTAASIGLGGVAATPIRARTTEEALIGKPWNLDWVHAAARLLREEGTPMSDHRASAEYRTHMLGTALLKLYHDSTITHEEVSA